MISAGCIISGSSIRGSVLCPNVRVHSFCVVEDSILMPGVRVGRHARIRRAIVDRDVFIPRGAQVGYNEAEDRRRHTVTDSGIVVVTKADEPFIGPIGDDALRIEAEFDDRGIGRESESGQFGEIRQIWRFLRWALMKICRQVHGQGDSRFARAIRRWKWTSRSTAG